MALLWNTLKTLFSRVPPYPYHFHERLIFRSMSSGAQNALNARVQKYGRSLPRSAVSEMKIRCFYSQSLQMYSMADTMIAHNESKGRLAVANGGFLILDPTFGDLLAPSDEERYLKDRRRAYSGLELDLYELFSCVVDIIRAAAKAAQLKPLLTSEKYLALRDEKHGVTLQTIFLEKKLAELRGKKLY